MKNYLTLIKLSSILITLTLASGVHTAPTGANPQLKTENGYTSDIFADLVVGVPLEDVKVSPPKRTIKDAGMVQVVFGSPEGLWDSKNETWQQTFPGSQDTSEEGDWFGWSLASGNFNGDGRYDLAVGVPSEYFPGAQSAGGVHIFYGAEIGGLSTEGNQFLHQDTPGVEDQVEGSDLFGETLEVGNFNGDDYDDLIIGARLEDIGEVENAGVVHIIYGSPDGLDPRGVVPDQLWHQDQEGISDHVEENDWFGWALAAGNFNRDDYEDLAIGVPGENFTTIKATGAVFILYGSPGGLTGEDSEQWGQWVYDVSEEEDHDMFGYSLAVGRLGDIETDLAIGVPYEDIVDSMGRLQTDAGAVYLMEGSRNGLGKREVRAIWQGGPSIVDQLEQPESYDKFGFSLAFDDGILYVGVPYEDTGIPYQDTASSADAGLIHVIQRTSGLPGLQSWVYTEGFGYADEPEPGDLFGYSLAFGDFDGDGNDELAVGAPGENCNAFEGGGVFLGHGGQEDDLMLCQGVNLPDQGEDMDRFGWILTVMPQSSDVPDKTLPRKIYLPLSLRSP